MQVLIKCKSKNIDRITNKTLADLELRKYIKTKAKTRTISHTKKVGLQELHSLEGLDDVKQQVEQLVNFLQVNKKRGTAPSSVHMAFYGQPLCWKNEYCTYYR